MAPQYEQGLVVLRFLLAVIPATEDVIGSRLVQDWEHHGRVSSLVWLLAAFGLCALLLAGAGVLGVAARKVARRTRELGLRMALGAQSGAVVWMVVRETLGLGTLGMAVGIVGALGVSRVLTSFLFGIEVWDPLTYGGALGLLGGLCLLAAFLPARRATRIEPVRALRCE